MTLYELRDALSAYPKTHPSPVSFGSDEVKNGIRFGAEYSEGNTVGDLLQDANSWDAGCDDFVCEVETDQGVALLTAHLLRAWLGPVPVVLPEGWLLEEDGGRRIEGVIFDAFNLEPNENSSVRIAARQAGTLDLSAAALRFLMTGEVTP